MARVSVREEQGLRACDGGGRASSVATAVALGVFWTWGTAFGESDDAVRLVGDGAFLSSVSVDTFVLPLGLMVGVLAAAPALAGRAPWFNRRSLYGFALFFGVLHYVFSLGGSALWADVLALATAVGAEASIMASMMLALKGFELQPDVSPAGAVAAYYVGALVTGQFVLPGAGLVLDGSVIPVVHMLLLLLAFGADALAGTLFRPTAENASSAGVFSADDGGRLRDRVGALLIPSLAVVPVLVLVAAYAAVVDFAGNLSLTPLSPELLFWCHLVSAFAIVPVLGLFMRHLSIKTVYDATVRVVFPLVVLSYMLLTQLEGAGLAVVLVCSFFAGTLCMLLFVLGALVVSRQTRLAAPLVFGATVLVWSVGMLLGIGLGAIAHVYPLLSEPALSVVTTVVFLVLVFVTFETGVQPGLKTLWGLEENFQPRAYRDRQVEDACARLAEQYGLSPREEQMTFLLACGMTPKKIAEELVLSVTTIRTHINGAYRKLGVHSAEELCDKVQALRRS